MKLPMNKMMTDDRLIKIISTKGRLAVDLRQVNKRLKTLMPSHLNTVRKKYMESGLGARKAAFHALIDKVYLDFLEECIATASSARESYIQYETHLMLFQARRSLRGLQNRKR